MITRSLRCFHLGISAFPRDNSQHLGQTSFLLDQLYWSDLLQKSASGFHHHRFPVIQEAHISSRILRKYGCLLPIAVWITLAQDRYRLSGSGPHWLIQQQPSSQSPQKNSNEHLDVQSPRLMSQRMLLSQRFPLSVGKKWESPIRFLKALRPLVVAASEELPDPISMDQLPPHPSSSS